MLTKLFPELTNEDYFEQTNNYRINVYERTELGTYFTLYTDVNSLNKTVFVNFIDATQEKVLVNIEYIVQKDNETLRYTVKSRVSDECSLRSQDPDKPVYSSIIFTIKNNKKIIKSFVRNNEMYEFYFDRKEEFKWEELIPGIKDAIRAFIESGQAVVEKISSGGNTASADDSDVVRKIKQLIDENVRPAVAMDGGDIVFEGFDEGIVKLKMMGACSGCPSSTATLKAGIQGLLTRMVPEVKEVQSV